MSEEDEIQEFVTAEKMPITIEFTQESSEKIFNSGISKQVRKCESKVLP